VEPRDHSCIAQPPLHSHDRGYRSRWICCPVAPGGVRWQIEGVSDRLNPIELFMWRVSQDPTLRMTVGTLMMLDRPPASGALGERLESAVAREPQLRRMPNDPTRLGRRPSWVEDPAFDIGNHLRTVTLPSPGSDRQLLDYVALLESIPFDRDKSPWDVTLIDGLEGKRGALYLRAHHVLTDGIGAIWLIDLLLDDADGAAEATPKSAPAPKEASEEATPRQDRQPGTVTIDFNRALRPLKDGVTNSFDIAPSEAADVMVRSIQRGLDVANSVSRQVLISGGPLASLPTSRSMASRFETLSVRAARASSLALGGSRNDLLVAGAAAGLGRYQERLGQPCPEL
jgi:diacylglycerol O-acyltransferase / wax synthase